MFLYDLKFRISLYHPYISTFICNGMQTMGNPVLRIFWFNSIIPHYYCLKKGSLQPFRTPHRILKHRHRSTLRIGFKVVAWISEAKRSRARVWKVSRLERMVKTPTIGKHRRSAEPVLPILSSNNVFRTRNLVSSVETYSSSHGRNNTSSRFYLIGS